METKIKLEIPQINIGKSEVTIKGTSPLIFHRWSEKAKRQILEKQMKTASSNKAKEARDPVAEYLSTFYRDSEGYVAFPALNLKQAIVASARQLDGINMTLLRGVVFVEGDSDGLVRILHDGKPIKPSKKVDLYDSDEKPEGLFGVDSENPKAIQMREDYVVIGRGSSDLRYRGQVKDWEAKFTVTWNSDVLSAGQVYNLLNIAGFGCGIGEWRPNAPKKPGPYGRFEIVNKG